MPVLAPERPRGPALPVAFRQACPCQVRRQAAPDQTPPGLLVARTGAARPDRQAAPVAKAMVRFCAGFPRQRSRTPDSIAVWPGARASDRCMTTPTMIAAASISAENRLFQGVGEIAGPATARAVSRLRWFWFGVCLSCSCIAGMLSSTSCLPSASWPHRLRSDRRPGGGVFVEREAAVSPQGADWRSVRLILVSPANAANRCEL